MHQNRRYLTQLAVVKVSHTSHYRNSVRYYQTFVYCLLRHPTRQHSFYKHRAQGWCESFEVKGETKCLRGCWRKQGDSEAKSLQTKREDPRFLRHYVRSVNQIFLSRVRHGPSYQHRVCVNSQYWRSFDNHTSTRIRTSICTVFVIGSPTASTPTRTSIVQPKVFTQLCASVNQMMLTFWLPHRPVCLKNC